MIFRFPITLMSHDQLLYFVSTGPPLGLRGCLWQFVLLGKVTSPILENQKPQQTTKGETWQNHNKIIGKSEESILANARSFLWDIFMAHL